MAENWQENARIANGIRSAVRDGVPDDQILAHLQTEEHVAAGVAAALKDGVPVPEIVNHLGRLPSDRNEYLKQFNPTEDMSGFDKFRAGWGKGVTDIARGAGQLIGAVDREDVDEAKRRDAPLMNTGAGATGNVVGKIVTTLPAAAIPGANTLLGATAIGAGTGFIEPVGTGESRIKNTLIGAAGGAAGNKIAGGLARIIRPNTAKEVQQLLNEGITPTPGQILGGVAQRVEEGATSVPILGDAIKSAQRRAVESFDRAALNRVIAPLNAKLAKGEAVGHETVAKVGDMVSKAYDDLLPKLKVAADETFNQEIDTVRQLMKSGLIGEQQAVQFEKIIASEVLGKFTPQGLMSGATMKQVESTLGRLVRQYGRSENADHRLLSDALKETQAVMRRMVERANPERAGDLKALNTAWANLVRVENAAGRIGSKEGVFSPAALRGAVKATDSSVRKRATARGTALMQDLAESGEKVLGSKVPDSGTPFRLANMATLGGGGFLGFLPEVLAAGAAGAGVYSKPGQYLAAALLARRPEGAKALATTVRKRMSPYAAALLAAGATRAGAEGD